ncbi:MAG: hypothetical protein LC138_14545 [Anaerolineales bacterium]|nr:hypothetical protein [Anaerolineales bacterium]
MIFIPISILAIFLWLGGYFMTARKMSDTGLLSDNLEKIISPPKWLYYLCGTPVSNKYPRGTMRVAAFGVQFGGIALGIYAIWLGIWKPSVPDSMIGLAFSTFFTYITTIYVSKNYVVRGKKKR